ncbi:MAG: hypothetical protein PHV30_09750 [Candidatus Margulisbacteria bacterium]|nr:hypothetical protein [Candidatus Margulisiibacteriota bacterium]
MRKKIISVKNNIIDGLYFKLVKYLGKRKEEDIRVYGRRAEELYIARLPLLNGFFNNPKIQHLKNLLPLIAQRTILQREADCAGDTQMKAMYYAGHHLKQIEILLAAYILGMNRELICSNQMINCLSKVLDFVGDYETKCAEKALSVFVFSLYHLFPEYRAEYLLYLAQRINSGSCRDNDNLKSFYQTF